MKFKIGDRVKYIGDINSHTRENEFIKDELVVTNYKIYNENLIVYELNNKIWQFTEDELELVNSTLTKEELFKMPIGTKITTDDNRYNVYIKCQNDFFINEKGLFLNEMFVHDDLTLEGDVFGTRILKVEKAIDYTLVYENTESKEMTQEEIEKALGYKVKIIK